jgi:hypothetical protein
MYRQVGYALSRASRRDDIFRPTRRWVNLPAIAIALAGVLLPYEMQVTLFSGGRFTPGRIAIIVLFIPSLVMIFRRGRRLIACDYLVCLTTAWMIFAALSSGGISALSSVGGDALDFFGGYLIARAFVFGRPALDTFVGVLKIVALLAIILGAADNLSGRLIVHDTIAALVNAPEWPQPNMRNGIVRATSTFDHAILFGVFCAVTAAILIYWEKGALRRIVGVLVCLAGCLLSLSSAALMSFGIAISVYTYDRVMIRFGWRWTVLWAGIGVLLFGFILVSSNPLSWIISHLTIDPQTGYFRLLIWNTTLAYVAEAPVLGHAYQVFGNYIVDFSVDSLWLLLSLRFGIPMVVLFFVANLSASVPRQKRYSLDEDELFLERMKRAFTLALFMLMFAGFTVHFWNYMWMFWGICLGIRASLRELGMKMVVLAGRRMPGFRVAGV